MLPKIKRKKRGPIGSRWCFTDGEPNELKIHRCAFEALQRLPPGNTAYRLDNNGNVLWSLDATSALDKFAKWCGQKKRRYQHAGANASYASWEAFTAMRRAVVGCARGWGAGRAVDGDLFAKLTRAYLARNLARCINNERRRLRKRAVRL